MPSLDTQTRVQLVRLRVLLSEAQRRATDRSLTGRHGALIALDGACERVLHMAAGEVAAPHKTGFFELFNSLEARIDRSGWAREGWAGVKRLHAARNAAQHEGVVPDPAEFASWQAEADRFIRALVHAAFGVDLNLVIAAEAVDDPELRQLVADAEAALDGEDAELAFKLVCRALDAGRERWTAQYEDALGHPPSRPFPNEDFTAEDVRHRLARLDELTEVMPFAADLGEYVWLIATRSPQSQGVPVSMDDARRAFVFVLGWILRWEAFSMTYRTSEMRYRDWTSRLRPPRTVLDDGEPKLVDAIEIDQFAEDSYVVTFQLADLPSQELELWLAKFRIALHQDLSKRGVEGPAPAVGQDGRVRFLGCGRDAMKELVEVIRSALPAASQLVENDLEAERRQRDEEPELLKRYHDALSEIGFEGRPLFGHLRLTEYQSTETDGGRTFRLVAEMAQVREDPHLDHLFFTSLHALDEVDIGGPLDFSGGNLLIGSSIAPETLGALLKPVVKRVEDARREEKRASLEAQEKRRELLDELREEIGPVPRFFDG